MVWLPPISLSFILADVLTGLGLVILAECIISFAVCGGMVDRRARWVAQLHRAADPMLAPVRRVVRPERMGGLDISPMIVLTLVYTLRGLILRAG